ncbi:hypothetical protein NDU88_006046 [Pleurodeles waltl]|uniref:Uncharacterized protein n=1 Tax=Pleurodeles waltl TaxID=8319 RepID=A0AAV7VNG7_PLEWA|nr:hypothetical protein NDU88_006046 [Pleurodeles waltl]
MRCRLCVIGSLSGEKWFSSPWWAWTIFSAVSRFCYYFGVLYPYSQRSSYCRVFSGLRRSGITQLDRAARKGGTSVSQFWCALCILGASLRSAYGAPRVPILKILHLPFRGSSALYRQRDSGWLSFSVLKLTVLHVVFARRGRALPASHGPGADHSSRAAPLGPCPTPPPLRQLRS